MAKGPEALHLRGIALRIRTRAGRVKHLARGPLPLCGVTQRRGVKQSQTGLWTAKRLPEVSLWQALIGQERR
jgi:hypothetical protein